MAPEFFARDGWCILRAYKVEGRGLVIGLETHDHFGDFTLTIETAQALADFLVASIAADDTPRIAVDLAKPGTDETVRWVCHVGGGDVEQILHTSARVRRNPLKKP